MLYVIGDIHGQADKLRRLLDQLVREDLNPADTLVFLGDYVDRGPDSADVLEQLLDLEETHPNAIFLRGNHEQMMLEARARYDEAWGLENDVRWQRETSALWFSNGSTQTLQSYMGQVSTRGRWWDAIPEDHWNFILDSRMEFKTEHYLFVHAGILPEGSTWEYAELDFDPRLWIREPFLSCPVNFGRTVVFGHTPSRNGRPLIMQNKIGLDTGAGWGGPLTAMRVDPEEQFDPSRVALWTA